MISIYTTEKISKKFQWEQVIQKEENNTIQNKGDKYHFFELKHQNNVNDIIVENQEENLDSDISMKESSLEAGFSEIKSQNASKDSEQNYQRHSIEFSNFTEFVLLIDNKYCVSSIDKNKIQKRNDDVEVQSNQPQSTIKIINDKNKKLMSFNEEITTDYLFNNINKVSMLCVNHPIQLTHIKQQQHSTLPLNHKQPKKNIKTYQIFELIKLSSQFFDGLPNSKFLEKKQFKQHNSPRQRDSKELKQIYLQDLLPSVEMKMNLMRFICFPQLQEKYHDLLEQKIYEPYFISNNTILEYENQQIDKKFSFCDIISKFNSENKTQSKLYFKVSINLHEYKKQQNRKLKKNQTLMISSSSKNIFDISQFQNEENQQENFHETKSPYYTNQRENYWKNKLMESEAVEYFEFDLKQFNSFANNIKHESGRISEQQDHSLVSKQIFVNIQNITNIIKSQQKLSDQLYLDAMEQNYSHEQMTPLNSILANSKIVYRRFQEIKRFQENILKVESIIQKDDEYEKNKRKNEETLRILKAIQQSGQIMWYYNQNQIQRMKIKKKEFKKKLTVYKKIEEQIEKVINPFEPQIASRNIKIFIAKKCDFPFGIKNDWVMYQLILFNIIQNAVKYNQFEGNILVILDCKPIQNEQGQNNSQIKKELKNIDEQEQQEQNNATHVLETEIIDTGIGISEERQKMLFIPFMELKMKQNLNKVKDNNIGMGLGCSQQIAISLGGDIQIKQSQRGLTIFQFKMPVAVDNTIKKKQESLQIVEGNPSNKSADISQQIPLINQSPDILNSFENYKDLKSYLKQQKLESGIQKLQIAEMELPPEKQNNFLKIHNNNSNTLQAIRNDRSALLKSENSESQSFHLQNNSNLIIQRQKVEQKVQLNLERRGNLRAASIQNIYKQESINSDQMKKDILQNKINNKKRLESKRSIMDFNQQLMQSKSSSERSIDKCQESSQDDNSSNIVDDLNSQRNQIMQIEQEIEMLQNIEIIQPDGVLNFLNPLSIQPIVNKSQSSKSISQKLSFNKHKSQNKQDENKDDPKQQKQQFTLIKPLNHLIDKNNKFNILDKNIEKDLTSIQKQQVLFSVLVNNHKDKLVKNFIRQSHYSQDNDDFIISTQIEQNCSEGGESQESSVYQVVINDLNQLQQQTNWPQELPLEQQLQQELANKQNGIPNQIQNNNYELLLSSQSSDSDLSNDSSSLKISKSELQQDIDNQQQISIMQDQQNAQNKQNRKPKFQKLDLILEQSKEEEQKDEDDPLIQQRKQDNKNINKKQKSSQKSINNSQIINSSFQNQIEIENLDKDSEKNSQKSFCQDIQLLRPKPIVSRQIQNFQQYYDDQEESKNSPENKSELRLFKQQINKDNVSQYPCGCMARILVVDDIEFNIIPVKYLIKENFDIDVEDASNGAIALQKYKDGYNKPCGCPDRAYKVIFMDLQMPVMGGVEASRKIMSLVKEVENDYNKRIETSIFALTAFTNQKSKDECTNAGIIDVFNKPLNYNTLHRVMWVHFYQKKQSEYLDIYRQEFQKSYNDIGL